MRVPDMSPEALPVVGGPGGLSCHGNIQPDRLIAALGLTHVWTHPVPGHTESGGGVQDAGGGLIATTTTAQGYSAVLGHAMHARDGVSVGMHTAPLHPNVEMPPLPPTSWTEGIIEEEKNDTMHFH